MPSSASAHLSALPKHVPPGEHGGALRGRATAPGAEWLTTVDDGYHQMLAAIAGASISIQFEFYIFRAHGPGERFRAAFIAAARRGVKVRVLLDGFGSGDLPAHYWDGLRAAGGEAFLFDPGWFLRLPIRNHQKLLVVDHRVAFVGGFNIGPEYEGDGVTDGWRDLGLALTGPVVTPLAECFDAMWEHRTFGRQRAMRALASRWRHRLLHAGDTRVMAMGPALGRNAFHSLLLHALREAGDVRITASYFVPGRPLRRALRRLARRGVRVRLLLAGKTDVRLVQAAGRAYYARLLRAGVEIAEYQPQILHTKLAVIDHAVFAGSSNLDARSLTMNYELMVRVTDPALAAQGRALFDADWAHARRVLPAEWGAARTWRDRLYGLVARFCLLKIDPWFARSHLRSLS